MLWHAVTENYYCMQLLKNLKFQQINFNLGFSTSNRRRNFDDEKVRIFGRSSKKCRKFDVRRRYFNGFLFGDEKIVEKAVKNRRRNYDCTRWKKIMYFVSNLT